MRYKLFCISALVICIAFTACGYDNAKVNQRKEVTEYSEKIIKALLPLQVKLEFDYGNIEFYNWENKEVKFEITKRIRGSESKDTLIKKLDKYNISINKNENIISFICKYKGANGNSNDIVTDLRIFIPKRTITLDCNVKSAKISFLDDLNCNLNISADTANIEINRLDGKFVYAAKTGNVKVSAGELKDGSSIINTKGNINIKADFEASGTYSFETGAGIIDLFLPADLNAKFESTGLLNADEFESSYFPAIFRLKNELGEINIEKF